jgi:NAD(P)-dependent dehydrogenase (short-subunit alcohol dehydrogenase family)
MTQRTVLLTGASGKFGRLFLRYLLGHGHRVIALVRKPNALRELSREYKTDSGDCGELFSISTDLLTPGSSNLVIDELRQRGFYVDCLINAARSIEFLRTDHTGLVSRDDFMQEYLLDVALPYELSMKLALAPDSALRQIINIGSQYGCVAAHLPLYEQPMTQSPVQYSVAKAALVQLTKELGTRLAVRNIQVNCISYGGIEGRVDDAFKSRYARLCPIGRMLNDEEVVTPLHMLFASPSMAMTGHVIHADGGWSLW